jgi:hypothetical protein
MPVKMPLPLVDVTRSSQWAATVAPKASLGRHSLKYAVSAVSNWTLPFELTFALEYDEPYS